MQEIYAKILGNHAADLITRTSRLKPNGVEINAPTLKQGARELAVRIDFKGLESGAGAVNGYVIGSFLKRGDALPLLSALAEYFGFDPGLTQTERGPVDILSEYLNIIIGLTGADWAEHGFDMYFSPPVNISGQTLDEDYGDKRAYHIAVHPDSAARLDIVAVFAKG